MLYFALTGKYIIFYRSRPTLGTPYDRKRIQSSTLGMKWHKINEQKRNNWAEGIWGGGVWGKHDTEVVMVKADT